MNNKAILFLSHLIPKEKDNDVEKYAKNNMQEAANALQWQLLHGFKEHLNDEINVINLMTIGSYPQYYKKAFVKKTLFDYGASQLGVNIGFCNLKGIRRYSIERNLYREVNLWIEGHKNHECIIIVYSLHPLMMKILKQIKSINDNVTVCAIVADMPDMMNLSSKKNMFHKVVQSRISLNVFDSIEIIDKFVFLTRYMPEYLNVDKPYCIVEGIATDYFCDLESKELSYSNLKKVLYAGTLHRKFGVLHLVEAFSQIPKSNYRLIICGAGDSESEIIAASKKDSRIVFKGQCSRNDVLKLQKEVTILVNPRMNIEEFTKYSFPSKNMEYMSSGTPLVAFKLDGIPDEYDNYITYVKDNSVETFAKTISDMCELSEEERIEKGQKARQFVIENKNKVVQTQKIINLLELNI